MKGGLPRQAIWLPRLWWGVTVFAVGIPSAHGGVEFTRDIQPLLAKHCLKCHGPGESNGGLRYDHRDGAFAQGDSGGHAIVPGKPEESALLERVTSTHSEEQMPPKGPRLSAEEVETLRAWIAAGAEWPADESAAPRKSERGSDHWAFQPVPVVSAPEVKDIGWSRGGIDRFLQAKREEAGLTAAPDAAPEVLVRRATYGLTGLPPTEAEVRRFVRECSDPGGVAGAMVRLVERLLASPRYGERWGRHWMDWVRYADTAGDNSDYPIPQAYLYRNYIIDSLNRDVPYNQFVSEQLAGDLLPAADQGERNRLNVATGYLAMARRFGSLVERYPWHLTIEDTIDNMGRTMLGLTLSCARCHDHKFDPVSTRDYYGLYGIFASTRYPFPGIELFTTQKDFVPLVSEVDVAEAMAPHEAETRRLEAELARLLRFCEELQLDNAAKEKGRTLEENRRRKAELDGHLFKARKAGEALAAHLKRLPQLPTAYAVQDAEPVDAKIQLKGEPDRPGATVSRKFLDVLGGQHLPPDARQGSGRLELARWMTDPANPLVARVMVNRVWQRHFGRGLVPTPSDFGLRGEPPTHPELLDWLAREFMRGGWSLKHLHRLIMTSRAYQLSSADLEDNLASDPGNRLYWKFNRQRLDAESIRDSLLLASGGLDLSPQTKPYPIPPPSRWGYTQHHPFKDDYPSRKRSVYQMTRRLTARPYTQTFDGPDPNVCTSTRDSSVTALQALYFVNDSFIHEQARRLAGRLMSSPATMEDKVGHLWMSFFARAPHEEELAMARQHLADAAQALGDDEFADEKAWASLIKSLLRLNEYIYLD